MTNRGAAQLGICRRDTGHVYTVGMSQAKWEAKEEGGREVSNTHLGMSASNQSRPAAAGGGREGSRVQ